MATIAYAPTPAMALLVAVISAATSACSYGPNATGAAEAARGFHRAVAVGDGPAACALLAPTTVEELERSTGQQCPAAVLLERLPRAVGPGDVEAYVRSALVLLEGDAVFVSMFGDEWRVTAAGCVRQPAHAYDCSVKGG